MDEKKQLTTISADQFDTACARALKVIIATSFFMYRDANLTDIICETSKLFALHLREALIDDNYIIVERLEPEEQREG